MHQFYPILQYININYHYAQKWLKQQIPSGSSICPGRSGHAASVVKYKKDKVKGVLIYGGLQDTDTYNTPLNDAWFLDLSRNDFISSSWKQVSTDKSIDI